METCTGESLCALGGLGLVLPIPDRREVAGRGGVQSVIKGAVHANTVPEPLTAMGFDFHGLGTWDSELTKAVFASTQSKLNKNHGLKAASAAKALVACNPLTFRGS